MNYKIGKVKIISWIFSKKLLFLIKIQNDLLELKGKMQNMLTNIKSLSQLNCWI